MSEDNSFKTPPPQGKGSWPDTRKTFWDAMERGDGAWVLNHLCEAYREPIESWFRWKTGSDEAARELTQEFFAREREITLERDGEKLFRTWLKRCLNNLLIDRIRHGKVRGSDKEHLLADEMELAGKGSSVASRLDLEVALSVHGRVLGRIGSAYEEKGWKDRFTALAPFVPDSDEAPDIRDISRRLQLSEALAKVQLHRLRREYMETFDDETRNFGGEAEIAGERRYLLGLIVSRDHVAAAN